MNLKRVLLIFFLSCILGPISIHSTIFYTQENLHTFTPDIAVAFGTGTAGTVNIGVNGTSANVTVSTSAASTYDFIDINASNVDSIPGKGMHSNFTAQQYGPDSTYDILTEGGVLGTNEFMFISGNDDFVRKLNKTNPGGSELLSWDTSTSYPFGLEYRFEGGSEYIYVVDKGPGADALIKFNANSGEEQTRWSLSGYSGDAEGLAWNGSRWFIADRADDLIYQADPSNPTVAERSFSYAGIGYCVGLAWDGSFLWAADEGSDTVYQIDIYGNIQTSWSLTFNPVGIAYDVVSGNLWIVGGSTDYLYEYYVNGTEINSWDPSGNNPEGVAYAIPEDYLLDLEVQWTNVDYDEANEELAIYINKGNNTHSLDATGGYMVVGDGSPDWGSVNGTISFWIKWDSFGTGSIRPRAWGQHENMETSVITFGAGDSINNNLFVDWGGSVTIQSNTNFTVDRWYFLAIVWNENTDDLFLYVGDQDTAPIEDTYLSGWTGSVSTVGVTENNFLASSAGIVPTDGHGDDLRYWDIDRTLTDIQADYNIELTGSETNLRSYFNLNNEFIDQGADDNDGNGSEPYSFSFDVPMESAPTEDLRLDVWNGMEWENLITNLVNGWNNYSISSYLSTSTFTIRFHGSNESNDMEQDSWNIDATLLHIWSTSAYDYVLTVTSQKIYDQNIRLNLYDSSNINRLSNCTLWFHDGSTSAQIIITDGGIVQDVGTWYLLPAGETRYIAVEVAESSAGTSILSIELDAIESGTIIYTAIMELRVE